MTVTLAMILKDAEPSIRRALDSVVGMHDDLVVLLDDATTDRTAEILREEYDAVVVPNEWSGFADARNRVQSLAQGDWLLILDGDEEIPDQGDLAEKLAEADRSPDVDGITVTVRTIHDGDSRKGSTGEQIRVYRNDPRLRWKFAIHNQLRGYRPGSILKSAAVLHAHYPADYDDRWERNEGRLLAYRSQHPDTDSEEWRHATAYLARGASSFGDHTSTIRYCKEACEADPEHVHPSCWALWVQALAKAGVSGDRLDEVIAAALEVQPNNPDVRWWDMQRAFSHRAIRWAQAVQHPDNRTVDCWSKQFVEHLPAAGKALGMTFRPRRDP